MKIALGSLMSVLAYFGALHGDSHAQTLNGRLPPTAAGTYQVITINRDGKSFVTDVAASGRFSVKGQKNASLHLINNSGRYFGPVVAPAGGKASSLLSGKSANLGTLSVKEGFATVRTPQRNTAAFDISRLIRYSRSTGPSGAGRLGLGRLASSVANVRVGTRAVQIGDDSDKDGLPNLIDIDDDGDLILDTTEEGFSTGGGAQPYVFNGLVSNLAGSINANAGTAITDALIDTFIKGNLTLVIGFNAGQFQGPDVGTANVDCSNLPYCGPSGTAVIHGVGGIPPPGDLPIGSPWNQYDPDGDGFPNLYTYPSSIRREIIIKPSVTTAQIGPGDTLLVKIGLKGLVRTFPGVLSSVYATVPAIRSYSDGVSSGTFTYPITSGTPGTTASPLQLSSTNLTLTFWRPQRRAIEGAETGTLIDMGKLKYGTDLAIGPSIINCAAEDYSNLSSTLSPTTGLNNGAPLDSDVLLDSEVDAIPDSSRTLSFTLNLASCISRAGISTSGQTVLIGLSARDRSENNAKQFLSVITPS